ncbi:hypothetical protein YPPY09_3197, partial [Yersinia pestis PY-09]
MFISTDKAVAL